MDRSDWQKDYEHFQELWEYRRESGFKHTAEVWDSRADDWEKELAQDGPFRRSLNERVDKVAEYLRGKGLLGPGTQVLDIGCGAGRFVAEFARTAGHVTGIDLSPRMLEVGADYAAACGLSNVSYRSGDFADFEIGELGWEKKFDLVFTSITPAIGTMAALEKAMAISCGYCFNSSFVRWEDELEIEIGEAAFGIRQTPAPDSYRHVFYSLFNLLWLKGYFPETGYHLQEQAEQAEVNEDLARYYAKCFSTDMMAGKEETRRVLEYLQEHAGPDGTILRPYKRWYGWILWDVRNRVERG